jgi:putative transposase
MARGFVYLTAVVDWSNRQVLARRVSIGMEVNLCLDALDEAVDRRSSIPTKAASSLSAVFTGLLLGSAIRISMDGRGSWRDNLFVERLWRSVK